MLSLNSHKTAEYLEKLLAAKAYLPVFLSGAPGIGKSSIVKGLAQKHNLEFIDLRLAQISPTDLRGLPFADEENNLFKYLRPEFLPDPNSTKPGILFIDELNMAAPALQGIAQQLILDRRVGNYVLPDGWHIWAAGNRKEDKASVFDMTAPVANRFIHLEVVCDLKSWLESFAINNIHPDILAFLSYKPDYLHKFVATSKAWPSPRSWAMASTLYDLKLSISPAVGDGAAGEFAIFTKVFSKIPDLAKVAKDKNCGELWPKGVDVKYATIASINTILKTASDTEIVNLLTWAFENSNNEDRHILIVDTINNSKLIKAQIQLANNKYLRTHVESLTKTIAAATEEFDSTQAA